MAAAPPAPLPLELSNFIVDSFAVTKLLLSLVSSKMEAITLDVIESKE